MSSRIVRLRDFDPVLLLSAIGLVAIGALLIYSASVAQFGSPTSSDLSHPVVRQVTFAGVGIALALVIAATDYRVLGSISGALYVISIGTLVFVTTLGEAAYGSRRWILIGDTQVQPSEIAKLVVIITLAKYLSDHQETIQTPRVFITSLALAGLPALLVFSQPDLGSSVVFAAIWLGMVVVAGARWQHLLYLIGGVAVAIPFAFIGLVNDYQRERVAIWLDPAKDPLGAGFQSLQAEIGIGSGGLFGKGIAEGSQTQLGYLRTETTDYVFSVLGEELGFIGAVLLFALFMLLLWRALRVAELSQDLFGRLIATGVAIYIMLQAFINVGVNIGLMPVTGIPLPFVSQGGSSLITLFIALGILQSILIRHRPFTFRTFYGS